VVRGVDAAALADVQRLAGVLFQVARVMPTTEPSGSSSRPPVLIGSSYWLIW